MPKIRCKTCKKNTEQEPIPGRDALRCTECSGANVVYPVSQSTKRKCHGGPFDGEMIGFRDDEPMEVRRYSRNGTPDGVPIEGVYVGRYVVRKIQQKNRVITRVEWETAEQKQALIRERLRLPGIRIY